MISSGMSVLVAVDVLGARADLFLGEAAEGVPNQLEVRVEVAGPLLVGQGGHELGVAEGRRRRRPPEPSSPGVDAPEPPPGRRILAATSASGVGDEGAGDAGLDVAGAP